MNYFRTSCTGYLEIMQTSQILIHFIIQHPKITVGTITTKVFRRVFTGGW